MTARISSISIYSEIARESFDKFVALEPQKRTIEASLAGIIPPDEKMPLEYELMNVDIELAKLASITIVFATISVEAYIYDYAARHFTDSFVKKYIDKLDPISKWVIVPKLVTGKELSRGGEWFQLLKNLVRERNTIIHSKSSEAPITTEEFYKYAEKRKETQANFFEKIKGAIDLLDILPTEMGRLDSEEMYWARIYLSKPSTTLEEK
jgi:hypothetical protein